MQRQRNKVDTIGYAAIPVSLSGVVIQSLNTPYTKYTFILFLLSAALWFVHARLIKNRPGVCQSAILIVLNLVAIWRWF